MNGETQMEMKIGRNIKRLRTEKNITQEQLSVAMNVTCAAVSKWEREETYPDITLLQPLAYYFGVTLDELMGYDSEKVQAEIDDVIALYLHNRTRDPEKAREIIMKAYRDYPNDYWIMHYYMWNIGDDMADNDPAVLIEHKEEFLAICDKLLEGCTEETLRLNAWNMRAKILHAEGKTEEALEIYRTKFTNWYATGNQKSEQLFAKDTKEYYFHVQRNMHELASFAADKLGRTVFFNPTLSLEEKVKTAEKNGDFFLRAFEETDEDFFLIQAYFFLIRMENDLYFRGGTAEQIAAVMDPLLFAAKKLTERMKDHDPLFHAYWDCRSFEAPCDLFARVLNSRKDAKSGKRAELLKNPTYAAVLNKYR